MATSKKKKQAKPRPFDDIRADFKKQVSCISEELTRINVKGDNLNIEPEISAIGDCINNIEEILDEAERIIDDKILEAEEKITKEFEEKLEGKDDELDAIHNLTYDAETCIGRIQYRADNQIDDGLMELFMKCMYEIQPAVMEENLKTILKFKTVF